MRKLNPKAIAPQHGGIFRDENVGKSLHWIESLEVGIGVFKNEFYED